jgi:hypothetical protein
MKTKLLFGIAIASIITLGGLTGMYLANARSGASGATSIPEAIRTDKEVGVTDTKTFRDSAIGKLEKGGLAGEGTHHLVLDSNPKNSAYLISSVVDLDEFVGKHIEVWGETVDANKVSWLMDVGRVKLLD